MENKVLVKLIFPELDRDFDVFIPVNEIIWKIRLLVIKSISDLCSVRLSADKYVLIGKSTGKVYGNNEIVIDTDIKNGTEIILIPIK